MWHHHIPNSACGLSLFFLLYKYSPGYKTTHTVHHVLPAVMWGWVISGASFALLPRSPSFGCSTCISLHSVIALLHLAASELFLLLSFQPHRNTEPYALSFSLLPSASLYLPHSLLRRTFEVVPLLFLAQDQTMHQKSCNGHWEPVYTWS